MEQKAGNPLPKLHGPTPSSKSQMNPISWGVSCSQIPFSFSACLHCAFPNWWSAIPEEVSRFPQSKNVKIEKSTWKRLIYSHGAESNLTFLLALAGLLGEYVNNKMLMVDFSQYLAGLGCLSSGGSFPPSLWQIYLWGPDKRRPLLVGFQYSVFFR